MRIRNTEDGDIELDDGTDDELDAQGGCVLPGLHDHTSTCARSPPRGAPSMSVPVSIWRAR